ncbi:MAG: Digeranylgeranylglycerophospholipid reductase [Methanosaeta sp. PtaU1.Bin112]|nr:MAG: Digeranylgeranylglycerophospholipid reductase [Methanosaeta sp. PtaU1.Bin112]
MPVEMYDLIVAGAGPAGSTAARAAVLQGLDTLILEKQTFPRYKPCGGALSSKATAILDYSLPDSICERAITGARVHFRDRVLEKHKGYNLTTLVDRSRFDDLLLKKAQEGGAGIINQKVMDFSEKNGFISVKTDERTYQSRFLVIASGCQDELRSRICGRDGRDCMGICLVADIKEDDEKIRERLPEILDIHFGVAEGGYGWIFPHRGYYSVGIGGLSSRLSHPRRTMLQFLRKNGFPESQRLHGHQIPQGGNKRQYALGRVLLAGDAAGFVDAFTGEGIYYALASGRIAGQVIGEVPAQEVARAYEKGCEKVFGAELRYALFFSKMMHRYPEIFMRILACQEEVLDRYIEIAAAKISYKDFIRWLLPRLPMNLLRTL